MKPTPTLLERIATLAVVLAAALLTLTHSAMAIAVGDRVQCTSSSWNIRSTAVYDASGANVIGAVSSPAQGLVLAGPTSNGGYVWWKVDWDSSSYPTGWSAQNYLLQVSSSPVSSSPGAFTLSNSAPYWNGTAPAVNLTWSQSSGATSYEVFRNGSLYASGVTQLSYLNSANLIGGQTYSYYMVARNSAGVRQSNTLSVTMPSASVSTVATPGVSPGAMTSSSPISVTMSCATSGATIRYTTNGSDPVSTSSVYGGVFTLSSSATVRARAYKSGMTDSAVVSATYTISSLPVSTVATPVMSPGTITSSSPINVTMSCTTGAATIRYTLNGSDPVATSTIYGGAFSVSISTTVKARAFKSGMTDSAVASAIYTISSNSSVIALSNNVTVNGISGAAGSARVYRLSIPSGLSTLQFKTFGGSGDADIYLKFGASPTTSSYNYSSTTGSNTETVTINSPIPGDWFVMVLGYGSYSGLSLVASYTAPMGAVSAPVISPGTITSSAPVTVSMGCATSGATVRYTINGSDPVATSTIYGGAFTVSSSTTVRARAFKSGMTDSAVASAIYTISSASSVATLSSNVPVSGLSGATGSTRVYKISVPSGQPQLEIKISGGSGDADLYVKYGSAPTTSSYTYRPYLIGNTEAVTISTPTAGEWYVMINGYSSYSGLSVQAKYLDIQAGDLLLYSGSGWIPTGIVLFEALNLGSAQYSHAAICLGYDPSQGKIMVAEMLASPQNRCVIRSLEESIASAVQVVVKRHNSIGTNGAAVAATARSYKDTPYAYNQIQVLAFSMTEPALWNSCKAAIISPIYTFWATGICSVAAVNSVAYKSTFENALNNERGKAKMICSEMCAWAYRSTSPSLAPGVSPWPRLVDAGIWKSVSTLDMRTVDLQYDYTTPNMLGLSSSFKWVANLK